MTYTHVHVRTGYSLMESTIQIDALIERAKELHMKSLAITDEHVLYGAIPFYQQCMEQGIKPIIGMNVHIEAQTEDVHTCTVLAKDNQGFEQISRLSTAIQTTQTHRISFEKFSQYVNEHTICIYHSVNPLFVAQMETENYTDLSEWIAPWQQLVQQSNFYIGIQDHGDAKERSVMQHVRTLYETYDIQVVAMQDVRYLHPSDEEAYRCLQAIHHGEFIEDRAESTLEKRRHLRSAEEMDQLFSEVFPEALQATEEIAAACNVSFDFDQVHMPTFAVPKEQSAGRYLRELCEKGLQQRYTKPNEQTIERMHKELRIIEEMGFSDYFLIVADFVDYAKRSGIMVGPGRGSAAGSLIAYVLEITNVDPIKHNLLFERFLNPERKSLPDIDIDFSDHRRDEVIAYVKEKYGKDRVAQIITFGTFGPRSLVREIGKVIELNEKDEEFVLRQIPTQATESIVTYVKQSKELFSYIEQSSTLQKLFRCARVLEGLPRHTSTHAAGIVISKEPLTKHTPLTVGSDGEYITQFAMHALEAVGLLKMDFLGLRNLSLIERLVAMVERKQNKRLDLSAISMEDASTFELLSNGLTEGIFQFESPGMTRVLTSLKPTEFADLVAVNALYRPGPMEYISTFIDRKNGTEKVTYPHEDIAPILEQTYGVLVYQEQIMQLANQIAHFSYGEADLLRRAISDKDQHLMEEMKQSFINGCMNNGYEETVARQLFTWIVRFSNYGFNKSHSVAYSTIAYQLAYIKAHEPLIFYTCLMSSTNQNNQIVRYMKEAETTGITITPPDINRSYYGYRLEKDSIRMGLRSIKGIGYQTVEEIIEARKDGAFAHLFDFCMRVSTKKVNRKTIETLIRAGAFDSTYANRMSVLTSLDQALEQASLFKEFQTQPSLLNEQIDLRPRYSDVEDMHLLTKLLEEKELIGRFASSHPLEQYRSHLRMEGFVPMKEFTTAEKRKHVTSAGIIQSIRKIRTKRGESMAFVTVSDEKTEVDAVIFPNVFRDVSQWLDEQQIVQMSGKVEERNGRMQYVIDRIQRLDLSAFESYPTGTLYVKLTDENEHQAQGRMAQLAQSFKGETPIIVFDAQKKQSYQLASSYQIAATDGCIQSFKKQFGEKNVVFKEKVE